MKHSHKRKDSHNAFQSQTAPIREPASQTESAQNTESAQTAEPTPNSSSALKSPAKKLKKRLYQAVLELGCCCLRYCVACSGEHPFTFRDGRCVSQTYYLLKGLKELEEAYRSCSELQKEKPQQMSDWKGLSPSRKRQKEEAYSRKEERLKQNYSALVKKWANREAASVRGSGAFVRGSAASVRESGASVRGSGASVAQKSSAEGVLPHEKLENVKKNYLSICLF
ncbi:MAG: hypothetical protein ACRCUJ_04655 [Phocaeicola sp.]